MALVTGASRGIGREIAGKLAGRGMAVFLAARDPGRCEEAVSGLRAQGHDAHAIALDVTDQATIEAAAKRVEETFGRLDVLVNNAGISGHPAAGTAATADLATVRAVFETNVFGVIAVTNAMLPLLRRSTAARVVNLSSSVGSLELMSNPGSHFAALPPSAAYAPSKTALNSLTVQYAKELRDEGILVNAADPGACATDFTSHLPFTIPRTAADGAGIAVRLATLGPDGPTGGYLNDQGAVPW